MNSGTALSLVNFQKSKKFPLEKESQNKVVRKHKTSFLSCVRFCLESNPFRRA
jgi:hypothetical protein